MRSDTDLFFSLCHILLVSHVAGLRASSVVQLPVNTERAQRERGAISELAPGTAAVPLHLPLGLWQHHLCFRCAPPLGGLEAAAAPPLWSRPLQISAASEDVFYVVFPVLSPDGGEEEEEERGQEQKGLETQRVVPASTLPGSALALLRLSVQRRGSGGVHVVLESASPEAPYLLENRTPYPLSYRQAHVNGAVLHSLPPYSAAGYTWEHTLPKGAAMELEMREGAGAGTPALYTLDAGEGGRAPLPLPLSGPARAATVRVDFFEQVAMGAQGVLALGGGGGAGAALGRGGIDRIFQLASGDDPLLLAGLKIAEAPPPDTELFFLLPAAEVSIVDSCPDELAVLTLTGIKVTAAMGTGPAGPFRNVRFAVERFQMDDLLPGTRRVFSSAFSFSFFLSILQPPILNSIFIIIYMKSFSDTLSLHLLIVSFFFSPSFICLPSTIYIYPSLSCRFPVAAMALAADSRLPSLSSAACMQVGARGRVLYPAITLHWPHTIQIAISEPLVWRLVEMASQIRPSITHAGNGATAAADAPLRIRLLDVSPLRLQVSFQGDPLSRPRNIAGGLLSTVMDLANFFAAPVSLRGLDTQVAMLRSTFWAELQRLVQGQLFGVAMSLVRSFGVVGGASRVLGMLSAGVSRLAGRGGADRAGERVGTRWAGPVLSFYSFFLFLLSFFFFFLSCFVIFMPLVFLLYIYIVDLLLFFSFCHLLTNLSFFLSERWLCPDSRPKGLSATSATAFLKVGLR
jgi:hypothetical protein